MKLIEKLCYGCSDEAIHFYQEVFNCRIQCLIHYKEAVENIRELERPPFMVIIESVRDKFGVLWTLMCDF